VKQGTERHKVNRDSVIGKRTLHITIICVVPLTSTAICRVPVAMFHICLKEIYNNTSVEVTVYVHDKSTYVGGKFGVQNFS
jgi:hypothetical protein